MWSYIFMWCRIFQEGSSLNIKIHKHSKRLRFLRSKHTTQDDLLCQGDIKFDNLWDHLASEAQQETNCELIFALSFPIYSGHLSELAGGVHQSDFRITVLDHRWGMDFITVKMWIPYWNLITGLRQWFTHSRCTNKEYSRKLEILQTTSELHWSCKH